MHPMLMTQIGEAACYLFTHSPSNHLLGTVRNLGACPDCVVCPFRARVVTVLPRPRLLSVFSFWNFMNIPSLQAGIQICSVRQLVIVTTLWSQFVV